MSELSVRILRVGDEVLIGQEAEEYLAQHPKEAEQTVEGSKALIGSLRAEVESLRAQRDAALREVTVVPIEHLQTLFCSHPGDKGAMWVCAECAQWFLSAKTKIQQAESARDALLDQIEHEGCVSSHLGDRTYNCRHDALCGLCRLRSARDAALRERDEARHDLNNVANILIGALPLTMTYVDPLQAALRLKEEVEGYRSGTAHAAALRDLANLEMLYHSIPNANQRDRAIKAESDLAKVRDVLGLFAEGFDRAGGKETYASYYVSPSAYRKAAETLKALEP